jgi:hypothetical protein
MAPAPPVVTPVKMDLPQYPHISCIRHFYSFPSLSVSSNARTSRSGSPSLFSSLAPARCILCAAPFPFRDMAFKA